MLGAEVVAFDRDGSRVTSVATRAAGHDARYAAPWFVLAAGGFDSGAIELDSRWATHERVLGLPLRGLPATEEPRFVGDYLSEQPMARVGVAVDGELRAEGAENVRGCRGRASGGGALARGVGRGDRAGERLARRPVRAVAVRGAGGSGGMSDHNVLEELMRGSLDHCVKCTICETAVPGLERVAVVPGSEVRRPAG